MDTDEKREDTLTDPPKKKKNLRKKTKKQDSTHWNFLYLFASDLLTHAPTETLKYIAQTWTTEIQPQYDTYLQGHPPKQALLKTVIDTVLIVYHLQRTLTPEEHDEIFNCYALKKGHHGCDHEAILKQLLQDTDHETDDNNE